jgi:hypothetical protein
MRDIRRARVGLRLLGTIVIAMWFAAFPIAAKAQNPSNNAVYYQTSGVGTCCQGSGAFIDASVFVSSSNPTICAVLFNILNGTLLVTQGGYPAAGAVVDARGISGPTALTCAAGTSPWKSGTTTVGVPSTILLPAGTIIIPTTWVLPNHTTLIGVGDALPSTTLASSTTIQACKSQSCSFSGTDMIDLGASLCPLVNGIHICNSVSVENLTLDGKGQSINGIVNSNSQTGSYVDHVSLYQILLGAPGSRPFPDV